MRPLKPSKTERLKEVRLENPCHSYGTAASYDELQSMVATGTAMSTGMLEEQVKALCGSLVVYLCATVGNEPTWYCGKLVVAEGRHQILRSEAHNHVPMTEPHCGRDEPYLIPQPRTQYFCIMDATVWMTMQTRCQLDAMQSMAKTADQRACAAKNEADAMRDSVQTLLQKVGAMESKMGEMTNYGRKLEETLKSEREKSQSLQNDLRRRESSPEPRARATSPHAAAAHHVDRRLDRPDPRVSDVRDWQPFFDDPVELVRDIEMHYFLGVSGAPGKIEPLKRALCMLSDWILSVAQCGAWSEVEGSSMHRLGQNIYHEVRAAHVHACSAASRAEIEAAKTNEEGDLYDKLIAKRSEPAAGRKPSGKGFGFRRGGNRGQASGKGKPAPGTR